MLRHGQPMPDRVSSHDVSMRVFLKIAQQVVFKFYKVAPQAYKGRFQPVARIG
jgi:hypothetical protein